MSSAIRFLSPVIAALWLEAVCARSAASSRKVVSAFNDPLARVTPDSRHSIAEERLVLLGVSSPGRLLTVMFTERGSNVIRLISAREATRRERQDYEKSAQ